MTKVSPVRQALRQRHLERQCSWLFAAALFGYPIVGNLTSLLQIDSRVLSIPFRIMVALFSAWLIITTRKLKPDGLRQVMLLIWFVYALRLLNDWLLVHLDGADYALQYFIVAAVLPALALMKSQAYDRRRFARSSFWVASAGAIASLLAIMYGNVDTQAVDSSGRLGLAAVDAVSLGHLSTSAIVCGVVLWRDASWRFRTVLLFAFAALLWCLILTGSKGPALALVICVGLWALRRGILMRFAFLALPLVAWMVLSSENPLAARLSGAGDDQSTVDRLVILNDSLAQIASSPWIGSAFVELNSGYYPHNVFIEAGLALGVPLALVFAVMLGIGAVRSWKTLRSDRDLLGLLYIQGLLAAAISGAIFGAILVWCILAMLPRANRGRKREVSTLEAKPPEDGRQEAGITADV